MVYFPEEVFRNIATFLVDPYKADRETHASVWQRIRVKRERYTEDRGDGDYSETELDEYCVYTKDGTWSPFATIPYGYDVLDSPCANIPFRFEPDDHLGDYDNLHEFIEYYIDGEYDGAGDEWHNYEFEQYE